jgi:hypothetical protein
VEIIFGETSITKGSTPVSEQTSHHPTTQASRFVLSNPMLVRSLLWHTITHWRSS